MSNTIIIALISALSALLGALIGAIPSLLQSRIKLRELEEQKSARVHNQTIELIKAYSERIKLLEKNKGVYSTYDPPLFLYWTFYKALQQVEGGATELSPEIKKMIAHDLKAIGRDPEDYGIDFQNGKV